MEKYAPILEQVMKKISAVKQFMPILYLVSEDRDIFSRILEQGSCFEMIQKDENGKLKKKVDGYNKNMNCNVLSVDADADSFTYKYERKVGDYKDLPAYFYIQDFQNLDDEVKNKCIGRFVQFIEELNEWPLKKNLVIISTGKYVPPGFEAYIEIIDVPHIGMWEIMEIAVREQNRGLKSLNLPLITIEQYMESMDAYLANLRGLSRQQTASVFYQVAQKYGWVSRCGLPQKYVEKFDYEGMLEKVAQLVFEQKKQMVAKDGAIEFVSVKNIVEPKGMDGIRDWVRSKKKILQDPGRAQKLDEKFPKGILIAGIPGSGKSLIAKFVSLELGELPLIHFRFSMVFNSLVGGTEENLDRVLKLIESVAPCVVWIDEIEKEMDGTQGSGTVDAGVASRCLARLLNWMQENDKQCFICATANHVESLPSELLRRGRFDKNYYTFLPMQEECVSIFVSLMKSTIERAPELLENAAEDELLRMGNEFFDKVSAMEKKFFTGADIEGVICDAKSILFDREKSYPYAYNVFLDALVEAAEEAKPYGESHFTECAKYWLDLRKNPFVNAALPAHTRPDRKYNYMLFDFSDFEIINGKGTWRKDLSCVSKHAYDRQMFEKLKDGISNLYNTE